jgi:hypothetical protein
MKKVALTAIIIFALSASLVAGTYAVEVAKANPWSGKIKPIYAKVSIESPQNNSEVNAENFTDKGIPLSFAIKTNRFVQSRSNYTDSHCFIVLDSKSTEFKGLQQVGQTTISNDGDLNPYTEFTLTGNTSLSNLGKGVHTVYVKYGSYCAWPNNSYIIDYIVLSSASVEFTLNGEINSESASPSPTTTPTITPSQIPQPSPTINPTTSIPPTPTLSPSTSPSNSPTQEPTLEHTQTASPNPWNDVSYGPHSVPLLQIGLVIVIALVVSAGVLLYFKRHQK